MRKKREKPLEVMEDEPYKEKVATEVVAFSKQRGNLQQCGRRTAIPQDAGETEMFQGVVSCPKGRAQCVLEGVMTLLMF